jgi:hypothetical protein
MKMETGATPVLRGSPRLRDGMNTVASLCSRPAGRASEDGASVSRVRRIAQGYLTESDVSQRQSWAWCLSWRARRAVSWR